MAIKFYRSSNDESIVFSTNLHKLVSALSKVLVVVLADDLPFLKPVVFHAVHRLNLKVAALCVGVRQPRGEQVRHGIPEQGDDVPKKESR
jgi:hypothetical protein